MTERPIPSEEPTEQEKFPTTPLYAFIFKSVEDIENEVEGEAPNSDELWFSLLVNPFEGWE